MRWTFLINSNATLIYYPNNRHYLVHYIHEHMIDIAIRLHTTYTHARQVFMDRYMYDFMRHLNYICLFMNTITISLNYSRLVGFHDTFPDFKNIISQ